MSRQDIVAKTVSLTWAVGSLASIAEFEAFVAPGYSKLSVFLKMGKCDLVLRFFPFSGALSAGPCVYSRRILLRLEALKKQK